MNSNAYNVEAIDFPFLNANVRLINLMMEFLKFVKIACLNVTLVWTLLDAHFAKGIELFPLNVHANLAIMMIQ